KRGRS
ncbi:thiamin/thiamine pyrophosphate ABC transporter, thiamin/thiamine pyrophospate-binding protein, partial [Vibrio parahaemolyticus V-223/04]